ncbi:MAG: ComF family protein [Candidatus Nanopelagicus sp.]
MLDSLKSLKELLFPLLCLSCSNTSFWLCPECLKYWLVQTKQTSIGPNPIFFKTDYNLRTSAVLLAAKENANSKAIKLLANSISQSITFALQQLQVSGEITLITIPSSAAAIRRRGRDHIQELAKEVQIILNANSIKSNLIAPLKPKKNLKDQSGLNSSQRRENTQGMFEVTSCEIPYGSVFLIDDLVTTGASITEGIRALFEAKITITAAVTACAVGRNSLIP